METKTKTKTKKKHSHHGHRGRMRNRYIKSGLDSLAEHEILELLLYYCVRQKNTNETAHKILGVYGSLSNLFEATAEEIKRECGLSENTSVLLSIIAPLARKYNLDKWGKKIIFRNSKSVSEYIQSLFVGESVECFYILFLDNNLGLIKEKFISRGTLDRVHVYPREFIRMVLLHNAANIILAHNHPSGDEDVSAFDIETTTTIKRALENIETNVIDHIVITGDTYISFAEDKKLLNLVGVNKYLEDKKANAGK